MSDAASRDTTLISVGRQCSAPSCLLVDFLPFKCHHCEQSFCGDHFLPAGHNCASYDESKHNRVAPSCPLCNEPIAIPIGQDPNIRMEQHISSECSVMTGRSKSKSTPVCSKSRCGKVLIAPIRCNKCQKQFCLQHRFPADHGCTPATTPSGSKSIIGTNSLANLSSKASASGSRTVDAFKRAVASGASSSQPPATSSESKSDTSKPSTSSSYSNPFSKVDRRVKAERESKRRAMQERVKRGLVTEEEKVKFAEEEAERSKETKERKDCVVM